MKKEQILKLTRTGLFLALTIAVQTIFRVFLVGLPQIIIVGSIVNLFLIATTVTCGFWGGFVVAVCAPIIAFFQGHIPAFPQMVFAVALGNLVIVAVFALDKYLAKKSVKSDAIRLSIFTVVGSVLKFVVLYLAVVKFVLPFVIMQSVSVPDANKNAMSALLSVNFSWPQLVTALIGGGIFTIIYPKIKKIASKNH